MANRIATYRNTIGPLPGTCTVGTRWPGFCLESHEVPSGPLGDLEFSGHLIVLERNPAHFRLSWKENGIRRTTDSGAGHAFVRSQQLLHDLWIGGAQRCMALSIEASAMDLALPEPSSGRRVELVPAAIGCDPAVNHLFGILDAEIGANGSGQPLVLQHVASAMAVYVASRFSANPPILPKRRGALDRTRLNRVVEYIESRLDDGLSLDELAGVACLSSYHFCRSFKASTGQSVHHYVLSRRIERARALLKRNDLTLAEIAARAGFSSQSQFTTAFRRTIGLSPGVWRRAACS